MVGRDGLGSQDRVIRQVGQVVDGSQRFEGQQYCAAGGGFGGLRQADGRLSASARICCQAGESWIAPPLAMISGSAG